STDNSLKNIDLVIPMNNKGRRSLAIAYCLLCRQLKRELNELSPEADWSVSIDDFETNL
ncbi:30S ribosomal protein S2, partial [Candidatus Bathyarchaeota archaeon]|nr:30S ribosomal protein S2 [Candidatus Bathyarchaeota archaeon]